MNKKNYVSQLIKDEKIDICCLQEIDLKPNIDKNLLSFGGYSLEIESNDVKARAGIYVKNGIEYLRRNELEGLNNGLVIIDLNLKINYRLINVYRIFNPTDGRTQRNFFLDQLTIIRTAVETCDQRCPIINGGLNLDEIMMNRLTITKNKIDYKMPNLSKDTYKLKCKNLFLQ